MTAEDIPKFQINIPVREFPFKLNILAPLFFYRNNPKYWNGQA